MAVVGLGIRGLLAGAKKAAGGLWQGLKGAINPAGIGKTFGSELLKYTAVGGVLGLAGIGPLNRHGGAQAPASGGLTQAQFETLYGRQGWLSNPFVDEPGLYERMQSRALAAQKDIAQIYTGAQVGVADIYNRGATERSRIASGVAHRNIEAQELLGTRSLDIYRELGFGQQATTRYLGGLQAALGYDLNRSRERMNSAAIAGQIRIADLTSGRALQGLYDTNRTQVALANRQLAAVQNTNLANQNINQIIANTQRYQADRALDATRYNSGVARLAVLGGIFRSTW